nr:TetR/AcrR family transcriptional regulator [uncultured Pseudodesulfovibrio sp.]
MAQSKIGRPRSEEAQKAILNAAHELLCENGGQGLTIEAIAKRAKVGKPTLYRWWPTLADIVLEAALCQADTDITVPSFVSLRETLNLFLRQSMKAIADGGDVHLRFLMAHAQQDDEFRKRFRDNFVATRREALRSLLRQAVECGQIAPGQNLETIVDIVFGAMWYRLLVGHASMDNAFAEELTELVIGSVQTSSA